MGYLTLNTALLDLNKVTISVWFRIPTAAAQARRAENPGLYSGFDVLSGVIPILTFGHQQTGSVYEWRNEQVGTDIIIDAAGGQHPKPVYGDVLHGPDSAPMPPSWIGVFVGEDSFPRSSFGLHLQTGNIAGGNNISDSVTHYEPFVGYSPDIVDTPLGTFTTQDTSFATLAAPVSFGTISLLDLDLDAWHHLLISWDLQDANSGRGTTEFGASTASGTGNASKLWLALDDENVTGYDLPAWWVDGGDPNDVLCNEVGRVAGSHQDNEADIQTISVGFSPMPSVPLSIPSQPTLMSQQEGTTKPVERIEMAELQIFCGVTLDTAAEANRRAFLDFKEDDPNVLAPADPEKAETLMGRRPEVLLHGTRKWQEGKNTGSIGLERPDDIEIPTGQFVPIGTIKKYTPDPTLDKSPAPALLARRRGVALAEGHR